jgi:HSP20 family protein
VDPKHEDLTMVYRTATLTPMFSLRREMDRLFDDAFGRTAADTAWTPAVDVREEPTAFLFELELPGVSPDAVEVTADGGVLSVRGEKRAERKEGDEGRWHIVERVSGAFRRTFQLPQNIAEERIEATFSNGLLTIRVPKAELPQPKRIEVKQG